MTDNQEIIKSRALRFFEYALLIFYLGVIILRVLYTEGPTMQTSALSAAFSDSLYSLYVSAGLLFSFLIWFVWSLCSRKFSYRKTGIEIGLLIFSIAAVISGLAAADKRLAINNIVSLFTPIFCAILMVQILDSANKVSLLLAVVAALGIVCAYQCADQLLFLNRDMLEQYKSEPESMLGPLNIQPGTLQYFLFEQRLMSSTAKAYFTTRNSAGSFLLLAFFAACALIAAGKKMPKLKVFMVILFIAIFLTKSKGAISGLFFGLALLLFYLKYSHWLKAHRKLMAITCLLLIVAGTFLIAWYGSMYHTLPGGDSMLVRWQYWRAAAQMFMAHPITGVGPGNFSDYYSYYKPAEAIESVTDPHNFPLSILTQYGFPGLLGFLLMIFLPLWKITGRSGSGSIETENIKYKPTSNRSITILCAWFGILMFLLYAVQGFKTDNFLMLVLYLIIRFCLLPVTIFVLSLYFLRKYTNSLVADEQNNKIHNISTAIIFCSITGFLLHNLTDYAIFEPGIYTTFWFLLAALVSMNANYNYQRPIVLKSEPYLKITAILAAAVISFAFLNYALIPVSASTEKINLANQAFAYGRFDQAHMLLNSAAKDDKLNSYALSLNAHMYMENAGITPARSYELLKAAQDCLLKAITRNPASYKNYEELSQVYLRLSESSPAGEKTEWLNKALESAIEAKNRYKGNERLYFQLAQIAEKLEKPAQAIEFYKEAVNIENQFRNQFHEMYPNEKVVSRLGEDKYQLAIKRIAELTNKNSI